MERLKTTKTQSATLLFLFSFIIGALCIYFTIMELVFPLVIVFAYSAVLYVIYRTKYLDLSSFEKNTPYYLGLLFSLFSLSIKSGFSFDSSTLLLTTMSLALSTTILGLIMRQILPDSYKTEISERLDNFYREIMDSLKKNTEEFLGSLSQLSLQLKKDFQDEESEEPLNHVKKLIRSYEVELKSLLKPLEDTLSHPDK